MLQQALRLDLTISEPWGFGVGPVAVEVLDRPTDSRWLVKIVAGYSNLSDLSTAILQSRYAGETLLPILNGKRVVVSLVPAGDRFHSLVGAAAKGG